MTVATAKEKLLFKEEELRFSRGQANVSVQKAGEGLSAMTFPFVS